MHLYLSQHGIAEPEDVNPDRPLTHAGRIETGRIASFAMTGGLCRPEIIIHSGKTRARETAEIFAGIFNPPGGIESAVGLSPGDDPAVWNEKAAGLDRDTMAVGHLPHLGKLASALVCGDASKSMFEFRNSCILCLKRVNGLWTVQWMLVPAVVP